MAKNIDIVITFYNAQEFVDDVFKGILIQNINLINKIIIINDCSTDNTNGKILTWLNRLYSFEIDYSNNSKNLGTFESLNLALSKTTSEFIAIIEGDDYWIDASKLETQLLQLFNLNIVATTSNSFIVNEYGIKTERVYGAMESKEFVLSELIGKTPFQLSTILFRRSSLTTMPELFKGTISNDKVIYTCLARSGNIYYSNECTSTYRFNINGISKSYSDFEVYQGQLKFYYALNRLIDSEFNLIISKSIWFHFAGYLRKSILKNEEIRYSILYFISISIKAKKWSTQSELKDCIYLFYIVLKYKMRRFNLYIKK